jgi:hypothetical protein
MRRIPFFILSFLATMSVAHAQDPAFEKLIDRNKPSVLRVYAAAMQKDLQRNAAPGDIRGAAVAIAPGSYLTACPTIAGAAMVVTSVGEFPANDKSNTLKVEKRTVTLKAADDSGLLCELNGPLAAPPVPIGTITTLNVRDPVFALGFAGGGASISRGSFEGYRVVGRGLYAQFRMGTLPGTGGSGVFDAKGQLIAILIDHKAERGMALGIPVDWRVSMKPETDARNLALLNYDENRFLSSTDAQRLVRDDPSHAWAWFRLGQMDVQGKRFREAINSLNTSARLLSNFDQTWCLLAESHGAIGDPAQQRRYEALCKGLKPSE